MMLVGGITYSRGDDGEPFSSDDTRHAHGIFAGDGQLDKRISKTGR